MKRVTRKKDETWLTFNPILKYFEWIQENRPKVSTKVYKVYKEIVRIMNDPSSPWEYDHRRACHAIEFIERYCRHSKGKQGGKPFIMELWELALVAAIFGIVHKATRLRKFQEVFFVVGRKNGKSTLAAAIGLYLQIGDGEPGAEVYACATKKDQAKIIWREAKRMVKKSPDLLKYIKPLVSELVSDFNDSTFVPLGADSETLDGLNVHGATMDEPHAWKGRELYDVIVDGKTAREQPLIFMSSTAGTVREGIYDDKYDESRRLINGFDTPDDPGRYVDERLLPIIYELNNRNDWTKEDAWYQANPGLGTIKSLEQLREKVAKAQRNPGQVKNLLTKDFNIPETTSEAWLTFEQLLNESTFDLKKLEAVDVRGDQKIARKLSRPRYGIGGADLSQTTDLTCGTVLFMVPGDETIYCLQMYWLPEDLLEKREADDKIPYTLWRDLGLLRTTPGNKIHHTAVTEWFLEVQRDLDIYLFQGGYDAWSADYWIEEMKTTFGKECWEPVRQGKQTLSGPMYEMGADLENKRINYNNNPITKWCLSNTAVDKCDKNNTIQPIKTNNPRRRIDGTVSMLCAYVQLKRCLDNYLNVI
jgi:phage terminase large subunit-like protein